MLAPRAMSCWKCGLETAPHWDACPACGAHGHTLHDSSKLWKEISTLKLIRKGVNLPPYRTSPLYGKGSRGNIICDFAVAEDKRRRVNAR